MLDIASGRAPGDPDRRKFIEYAVREFLRARSAGDSEPAVALLAPDFVYRARGDWSMWPLYAGPIARAQFQDAVNRINADYEDLSSTIHEFLIDGDLAAVHVTCAVRSRGSGAPADVDFWLALTFRDALVVEMGLYVDVAKAAILRPGLVEVQPARRKPAKRARARVDGAPRGTAPNSSGSAQNRDEQNRNEMERLVRDLLALRRAGDLKAIERLLAPDFVYRPRGAWTRLLVMPGPCARDAYVEALARLTVEIEELGGEIHECLTDGDRLALHWTRKLRNRGSGAVAQADAWGSFRVRDGLIVEMAGYLDAARAGQAGWAAYAPPR